MGSEGSGSINIGRVCKKRTIWFCNMSKGGRPPGAPNLGQTRPKLMEILRRAGVEPSGAQPTKAQLLELCRSHGIDPNGDKNESIKKFWPMQPCGSAANTCNMEKAGSSKVVDTVPDSLENSNDEFEDTSDYEIQQNQEGVHIKAPQIMVQENEQPAMDGRPGWYPELAAFGYQMAGIAAPNKAVQAVLACIQDDNIHKLLICKETSLLEEDISVILFYGMSNMLDLVAQFFKRGYNPAACDELIEYTYRMLPAAHVLADDKDEVDRLKFITGLTTLEAANGLKITYKAREDRAIRKSAPRPAINGNCLFNIRAPDVDRQNEPNVVEEQGQNVRMTLRKYNLTELNLFNCGMFPIMSRRNVEIHAEQFHQALWESKNLGVIAPISRQAWIKLANLSNEEVKKAKIDAMSFTKHINKSEVEIPFDLNLLNRKCKIGNGLYIGQKGHMAKMEEKRNDFYVKRIWRTYCPFFKCNCELIMEGRTKCKDNIIWFDHIIWFMMNNLDVIWPDSNIQMRFHEFTVFLSSDVVKEAVLAYIGYLSIREMMIGMTERLAQNNNADLKTEFGGSKAAELLEKTIKPISFLAKHLHDNSSSNYATKRRNNSFENPSSGILRPPKIKKKAPSVVCINIDSQDMNEGPVLMDKQNDGSANFNFA